MLNYVTVLIFTLSFWSCGKKKKTDEADSLNFSKTGLFIQVPEGIAFSSNASLMLADDPKNPARWSFVRQSATWARLNTIVLESIILPLRNNRVLEKDQVYAGITANALLFWKISPNVNESQASSAFDGKKTFAHKFELWRNSDKAKAMEVFFDTPSSASGNGILLYYQLNVLNGTEFDGDNVVTESYTFGDSPAKKQTYTWTGGSIVKGGTSDRGRVVLEEMDAGNTFCFKSVVRFNGSNKWCGGTAKEYYGVAYSQKFNDDSETTATFSLTDGMISGTPMLCSVANPYLFGTFNKNGFIADGLSTVAANFPPTSRVTDALASFTKTPRGPWDDLRQITFDALNIAFKNNAAP